MQKSKKNTGIKNGFTLIEALVFLFIFTTTVFTFYQTTVAGMVAMGNVKARIGAVKLANERMEIIRNIDYNNIGTQGAVPLGPIVNNELDVYRGGRLYDVNTVIKYVDDEYDGNFYGSDAARSDDYKRVRVTVFWERDNFNKSVSLESFFVPPGIEEVHQGGILKIKVVDFSNQPINGAKVTITNTETATNTVDFTNNGYIFLPGYKESIQKYKVKVEKEGYFTVQTYDPFPLSAFLPSEVHGTVLNGSYNSMSLVTDRLAKMHILTKDMLGNPILNLDFSVQGGKEIGTDPVTAKPVYSYSKNLDSGSDGKVKIVDTGDDKTSPGLYSFIFNNETTTSGYEFLKINHSTTTVSDFWLPPASELEVTALFADKNMNSFIAKVVSKADSAVISGVEVNLKNSSGYDRKDISDQYGMVYFPLIDDSAPLDAGEYDIIINGSTHGYANFTDKVVVNKLTKKTLELEAP